MANKEKFSGYQWVDKEDFLSDDHYEGPLLYDGQYYGLSSGNEEAGYLFYPWNPAAEEIQQFDSWEEIWEKAAFSDGKLLKEVWHLVWFGMNDPQ